MKKISKYYDYISTGLLTLITFFALAFSLMKTVAGGMGMAASFNGFAAISFVEAADAWLMYLTGIICILQLAACITMTIFFIIMHCSEEKESYKKLFFIFNIIFISFLFVYMILGIIYIALYGGFAGSYTLAYIPFLLGVFVFLFYLLQKKMNGSSGETAKKAPAPAAKAQAQAPEAKAQPSAPAAKAPAKKEEKTAAKK